MYAFLPHFGIWIGGFAEGLGFGLGLDERTLRRTSAANSRASLLDRLRSSGFVSKMDFFFGLRPRFFTGPAAIFFRVAFLVAAAFLGFFTFLVAFAFLGFLALGAAPLLFFRIDAMFAEPVK